MASTLERSQFAKITSSLPRSVWRALSAVVAAFLLIVGASNGSASEPPLSLQKPYKLDPPPNYAGSLDPNRTALTDGIFAGVKPWPSPAWVGWRSQRYVTVTVDLGSVEPIGAVAFTTGASPGGVRLPTSITLLVSDDGKAFRPVAEIVPAAESDRVTYAERTLRSDGLNVGARFLKLLVIPNGSFVFCDEVQVFSRQSTDAVNASSAKTPDVDLKMFAEAKLVQSGVRRRIVQDLESLQARISSAHLDPATAAEFESEVRKISDRVATVSMPSDPRAFRAVFPENALHGSVFALQAKLWRHIGIPPMLIWSSGNWEPLEPISDPYSSPVAVDLAMMRGEFRAASFNISNSTASTELVSLAFSGLQGKLIPTWISVEQVEWTDTRDGAPVASALTPAPRGGTAYTIRVDPGITRQIWLTFHPTDLQPGRYVGTIEMRGGHSVVHVPVALRIASTKFPSAPRLLTGGFDYSDDLHPPSVGITPANRDAVVSFLRSHFVNVPWGSKALFSAGQLLSAGKLSTTSESLSHWLALWQGAPAYCVAVAALPQFAGSAAGTAEFNSKVATWTRYWAEQLRLSGIDPTTFRLLLVDEPMTEAQVLLTKQWADAVRGAATGLKIFENPLGLGSTQRVLPLTDVLCLSREELARSPDAGAMVALRRPEQSLAFYSAAGPARGLDPYTYYRLQPWLCWRYGATESHFWSFSDNGRTSSWNEYLAQNVGFVPYFLDATSAYSSKQMESLREGVEDYEYLALLRDRCASQKDGTQCSEILQRSVAAVLDADGASNFAWTTPKSRGAADVARLQILDYLEQNGSR